MTRYFLVGGAGFIGSHCIERLCDREPERITIFDNFCTGRDWHLAAALQNPRVHIIRGDAKDLTQLRAAMTDHDVVYHFAANADIAKAASEPTVDFWEGTYLTQNVLEAMRLAGARRLIYMSGSGVYGDLGETPVVEDRLTMLPVSPYGAGKLGSEALISAYVHMFGLEAIIYRFANVVGPRQTHGVGYDFIRRLLRDPTRLQILGDGTQTKSYLYVDDVIDAITLFNDQSVVPLNVFNVATQDYITVTEIAQLAIEVLRLENVRLEYAGGRRGWKGDVPVIRFDSNKLRSRGWANRHTSQEAIRKSMQAIERDARLGRFEVSTNDSWKDGSA